MISLDYQKQYHKENKKLINKQIKSLSPKTQ